MSDKAASIIGFAIKAGKVIFGLDEIEGSSKKRYLMIRCPSLSPRSKKNVESAAKKDGVPLLETAYPLDAIVHKGNCKVIAITDKQMADAILSYKTEDYLLIRLEEI